MKNSIKIVVICVLIASCTGQTKPENSKTVETQANLIQILDGNNDGKLNPYEALDIMLQLQKEHEGEISVKDFQKVATEYEREIEQEYQGMFQDMDKNNDGRIQFDEVDKDDDFMQEFMSKMDTDNDKAITFTELKSFDFASEILSGEEEVKAQVEDVFKEYKTGIIELSGVKKNEVGRFTEWDENNDGKVTKEEALSYLMADNTPVKFTVKGTTAHMRGVITAALPSKVLQLIYEHPEVTTIEMSIVPGSIDDVANLRAGLYVYNRGLTTKLNSNSAVASGGTDFFLSGKKRIVEKGATLGVHSWGGGGTPAVEVPKDDPVHIKYLEFYKAVDVPEEFYWYTLEAAPAEDIHIMTEDEIKKYNVRKN